MSIARLACALAVATVAFGNTLTTGVAQPAPGAGCHSNYVGACLPRIARDVDCYGGTGDGPFWVGPVYVVDTDLDVYDLDRDHDHLGCEDSLPVPRGMNDPHYIEAAL